MGREVRGILGALVCRPRKDLRGGYRRGWRRARDGLQEVGGGFTEAGSQEPRAETVLRKKEQSAAIELSRQMRKEN